MKKLIYFFIIAATIMNPLVLMAQEGGWKNLKWGMTLKDIKKNYINEDTGKKCENFELLSIFNENLDDILMHYDNSFNSFGFNYNKWDNVIQYAQCSDSGNGEALLLYKGNFWGRFKDLRDIDFSDKKIQDAIMQQLKDKYPKAKIIYKKTDFAQMGLENYKYPVFDYQSDSLIIFNTNRTLYFLDPKTFSEIGDIYLKDKQQDKQKEQKKIKVF